MANYTGIQGQNILIVSSDPANPTEGQIWYNSTSNLLKGYANVVTNAWASGGNLNTARNLLAGAGTQTTSLAFGGSTPGNQAETVTEEYNGTTWTNNPTGLNTGRRDLGGAGIQTAALAMGGFATTALSATESYNGSSWTSVNPMNTARRTKGAGTQTAAISASGGNFPSGTTASETWNGTSWTSTSPVNTSRASTGNSGQQTSALFFAGYSSYPTVSAATESWNGSSWTTVNSMNTARAAIMGFGSQTATVGAGGLLLGATTNYTGATELWNGTSWTSNPNSLATARGYAAACGTQASGLNAGGSAGAAGITTTEEWTGTNLGTRTITTS
jgi:hypothetical protein